MPSPSTLDLERLLAYFRSSRFEYLALQHPGGSLTLCREPAADAISLLAPSVGVIQPATGSERLPRAGDRVEHGEPLASIRRLRSLVEVRAPASGRLACAHLDAGRFVEYGEALAVIEPD